MTRAPRTSFFRILGPFFLGAVAGLSAFDTWVGWLDRHQWSDSDYYLPHDEIGWVPRPNYERAETQTRLDRFGMRSPEIPADARPDEFRILVVGGSRLYGAGGVSQPSSWAYSLQASLDKRAQGRFRVLNGSVMGHSTAQSCRRALSLLDSERQGVRIDPDLLVVSISPRAQVLLDPMRTRRWTRVDGRLIEVDLLDGLPRALWPARARLHSLMMRSSLFVRHRSKTRPEAIGGLGSELEFWSLSRAPQPSSVQELIEQTFEELLHLDRVCAERGIQLRVLVQPEWFQDGDRPWRRHLRRNAGKGVPPAGTPRLEGVELLIEECRRRGLAHWDFSDEITALGSNPAHFYVRDRTHWSGHGHSIIAAGFLERLEASVELGGMADPRSAAQER